MKRTLGVVATLALCATFAAAGEPSFPSGTYRGTADWRGPGGSSGTYTVEKTFSGATMSARYTWTQPEAREERHTLTFAGKAQDPGFDVLDERGQVVGQGHCYDESCAYRATFGPVSIDESFRFTERGLAVLGAKSGPGFSVVWKEALTSQ